MTKQGSFVIWFCLLGVCFLVRTSQVQVPNPEQCLISGIYSLIQLPEMKDGMSCWNQCMAEPGCHMAVVTRPLSGSSQCLLVNCQNQGSYSLPRDPSTEIMVYPKSSNDDEQREFLRKRASGSANERLRCFDSMNYSSCSSGGPRFFYNGTSFRCERFFSGCGSNKNSFETREGCEALCNEKFRCYRPSRYGGCSARFLKFFYNTTSQRCERFDFSGCGSNGNIFSTAEECERLCADAEGTTPSVRTGTTRPAISPSSVDSGLFTPLSRNTKAILYFVSSLSLLLVAFAVSVQRRRCSRLPPVFSDKRWLLSESDVERKPDRHSK
ncbi:hypothetical protein Q5P01_009500 [Channa striata]|uniref:BPTI/Kunitz inhibitor domain-containing protein n=1 Tax=Channa striata TaxID=64152 RepID=A0AA88MYY1_CHASR|nr:hypothetical protein Q5P01_009500 [Channa striata]